MKRKAAVALGVVAVAAVAVLAYKSSAPPATTESDAASPAPTASASAATAATLAAAVDAGAVAELVDAGEDGGEDAAVAATAVAEGKAFPPLAKGAAWSVVRWDMSREDVEQAFRSAGVAVAPANDKKTGEGRLALKHGAWDATVYFTAKKPSQIVVTGTSLSKDAAAAVGAKMRERGGAPSRTTERDEHRWKKAGAGTVTFVAAGGDASWTTREEYVRDGGAGAVGFAQLTWGMAPAAAEQALTAAGWSAHVTKAMNAGLDPCSMPNAPPECAKKAAAQSVVFTKGEQEGTASFGAGGLVQVVVSGPVADKAAALARAREIEGALGKAKSVEVSTKTQHEDAAAKIDLEVREREPEATFTVLETYRPKK